MHRPTVMWRLTTACLTLLLAATRAGAADLAIGLGSDITTMDPHFANISSNADVHAHVFEKLMSFNGKNVLEPKLAESWTTVDPLTWEFKLRRSAKFHDGSDVTAEDVIYSLDRPATLTNSPSPFTLYTKFIVEKVAVDRYTVRLKTATPHALMLEDLTNLFIVSKKAMTGLSTEDMNAGRGMLGTGAYRFVSFRRGDRIEFTRNDQYWGARPQFEKVTQRIVVVPATRVAALLAGDVQVIDRVPPADLATLKTNPNLSVFTTLSSRVIYLSLDVSRDVTPFATDKAGVPLPKNPLKDARVRAAISKAINRAAIVDKVMEGNAVAAAQMIPLGWYGAAPALKPEAADLDGARKLLAQAGYPDGFQLTIHGTNDRYVNDAKILQTIAQMLTRVGIVTKVDSMPVATFFGRASKNEFSVLMAGWGGGRGHPDSYMKALSATYDAKTGFGSSNYGRYSNPRFDALVVEAEATIDPAQQEKLWQQAATIAMGDQAILPLHNQVNLWAARKGYVVVPRVDESTPAYDITLAR